jgi:integration host factor subunit beta
MNKKNLAKRLSNRFGFNQHEASGLIDHLLETISVELEHNRRVELRGLGTFGTKQRRPSLGRVVKTGETVTVPSLRRVYFRPGQTLKEIKMTADSAHD